nr:hypothetical protein BaRGS_032131 [Batillaria attramentaria]
MFPRAGLDLGGAVYPMYQDMASRRRSFPHWDDRRAPHWTSDDIHQPSFRTLCFHYPDNKARSYNNCVSLIRQRDQ